MCVKCFSVKIRPTRTGRRESLSVNNITALTRAQLHKLLAWIASACALSERGRHCRFYIYKWRPRYPLHTHTDTCNNILSYIIYYLYKTPKHGVFTAVKTRLCTYLFKYVVFLTFAINVFSLILFFNNIFIF
jgi:hypothetical protein